MSRVAMLALALSLTAMTPADSGESRSSSEGPASSVEGADLQPSPVDCAASARSSEGTASSRCFDVALALDAAAARGTTRALKLTVSTAVEAPESEIVVRLPYGMSFASLPRGWESDRYDAGDGLDRSLARARASIAPESALDVSFAVTSQVPGAVLVEAEVRVLPWRFLRGESALALTIGEDEAGSMIGHRSLVSRIEGELGGAPPRPPPPGSEEPAEGKACVKGKTVFAHDGNGGARPARGVRVEVWDQDLDGGSDLLGTAQADGAGQFVVCFENHDEESPRDDAAANKDGQDPYLVVTTVMPEGAVEKPKGGERHHYEFPAGCDQGCLVSSLSTDVADWWVEAGTVSPPAGSPLHLAFQVFDVLYSARAWTSLDGVGGLWGKAADIFVVARYPDVKNAYATTLEGTMIGVTVLDALHDDRILRGIGHHLGAHSFVNLINPVSLALVDSSKCFQHITTPTADLCAFLEGFATWFSMSVRKNTLYGGIDLETWTWHTAPQEAWGPRTPASVAAFLLDLGDDGLDLPWDRRELNTPVQNAKHAPGELWNALLAADAETLDEFREYYDAVYDLKEPVERVRTLSTLFGSTMDFDFRDPLENRIVAVRPFARTPHHFRIDPNIGPA